MTLVIQIMLVLFVFEVSAYLLTLPLIHHLLPISDWSLTCGGYSLQTLYNYILFSQVWYFAIATVFMYIDAVLDRYGLLQVSFGGPTSINWDLVLYGCNLAIMNSFLTIIGILFVCLPLIAQYGMCISITTYSASGFFIIILKIPLICLLSDIIFYVLHRLFHSVPCLLKIHRMHHCFRTTHAIHAVACHPVEHLAVNCVCIFGSTFAAGVPIEIHFLTLITAITNTTWAHSGRSRSHALHHLHWDCNYGHWLCDSVFGTVRTWTINYSGLNSFF